jgi:archaeosine synthase beta-subunit
MKMSYPDSPAAREKWILDRRSTRNNVSAHEPYAFLVEEERSASGEVVPVATIFLTNRECPFHCLMCDLWRNTLSDPVPRGAIPEQIDFALARLPTARQIKLYNSGSFFDAGAIPVEDYAAIAEKVRGFDRVIVESHPAFIGENCLRFRDLISGELEVAIGLETAHPQVLEKLNKRMTLDQFAEAAEFLRRNQIALRGFLLVNPPFIKPAEALEWTLRGVEFALQCGAGVITLIPTRAGNGALEMLAQQGEFMSPRLSDLEEAFEKSLALLKRNHVASQSPSPTRIFADLWDIEKFSECSKCFPSRLLCLRDMNNTQKIQAKVVCAHCAHGTV